MAQKISFDFSENDHLQELYSLSDFRKVRNDLNSSIQVLGYLHNNLRSISNQKDMDLKLVNEVRSPSGFHYTFKQMYKTVPIYTSQVKVNIDTKGNIRSLFEHTFVTPDDALDVFPASQSFAMELRSKRNIETIIWEKVYFPISEKILPAICYTIRENDHSYYELVINLQGETLYQKNLNRYFAQDSIVSVSIFNPDPLTTALTTYGAPYVDNSDADNQELTNEIDTVLISLEYDNDTFRLKGPYIEIKEFSSPVTVPVKSVSPTFHYTRSDQEFEDVNAYYHISFYQQYIQSLGFTNLVNFPIGVDAHALNGQDNSMFSGNQLYFGEGGVDDAEDADVIIHEYGHAISASAAPNTWNGFERKAMDEGLGDYLATSYGRDINSHNWQDMFSWDGHNEFWGGRTTETTKMYPNNLGSSIHSAGEIWSSTLMQIWESIGKETTDQLLLQSLYSYASNMSMTDAAYLFLDADSLLNNGANYFISYYWFEQRGILPPYPDLIAVVTNVAEVSCADVCDAIAVVNGLNGTPPYTYEWRDDSGQFIGQVGDTASSLCFGNYLVFVTDSTGDSALVPFVVKGPDSLALDFISYAEQCVNCNDGMIVSVVSGGTPPYTYLWDDPLSQTTVMASGLNTGYYSLQVQDVNGCMILKGDSVALLTGLSEMNNLLNDFVVSPNPSDGVFSFYSKVNITEGLVLKVYNAVGQQVFSEKIEMGLGMFEKHDLNLVRFGLGAYYLEVQTKRQIGVVKLIVF